MLYLIFSLGFSGRSDAQTQGSIQQIQSCFGEVLDFWNNFYIERLNVSVVPNIASVCS